MARESVALYHARVSVRYQATAMSHRLLAWRPDPDRPGYQQVFCQDCRAGASLHLDTAHASLSDALVSPCVVRPFRLVHPLNQE